MWHYTYTQLSIAGCRPVLERAIFTKVKTSDVPNKMQGKKVRKKAFKRKKLYKIGELKQELCRTHISVAMQ